MYLARVRPTGGPALIGGLPPASKIDKKHPLDPGWIRQLDPVVQGLFFDDPTNVELLRRIRRGRHGYTAIRAGMVGSFTPIYWALGVIAASTTALIALPIGLTIAPIVTISAWGALVGLTAAYHGVSMLERVIRTHQIKLWRQLSRRVSEQAMEIARTRHSLSHDELRGIEETDLKECDRFATKLLALATLGRELDENRSRRLGALIGAAPFAIIAVPFAIGVGLLQRARQRRDYVAAQDAADVAATKQARFSESTDQLMTRNALDTARWSGLSDITEQHHLDAFDQAAAALQNEQDLRIAKELRGTNMLVTLASLLTFVAGAVGTPPSTTVLVINAIGQWAAQHMMAPTFEAAFDSLAQSSKQFSKVVGTHNSTQVHDRPELKPFPSMFRIDGDQAVVPAGPGKLSSPMTFTIHSGSLTRISGPNGSFKTSLMLALRGERKVHSGRLFLHSRGDIDEFDPNGVLFMPSDPAPLFRARLSKWGGDRERARAVLKSLGRTNDEIDKLFKDPEGLLASMSRGQRSRTLYEFTAALSDAPLVILDEPLAHLDPENARQFLDSLRTLTKTQRRTIVVVDNTNHGLIHCDQLIILDKTGKVLRDDNPLDALMHIRSPPWTWPLIEPKEPEVRGLVRGLSGVDLEDLSNQWQERYGAIGWCYPTHLNIGDDPVTELFKLTGFRQRPNAPMFGNELNMRRPHVADERAVINEPALREYLEPFHQASPQLRAALNRFYFQRHIHTVIQPEGPIYTGTEAVFKGEDGLAAQFDEIDEAQLAERSLIWRPYPKTFSARDSAIHY